MTTISTKRLRVKFDACEEGIEAFAKVYPVGLDPAAWTREEQLRVLQHTKLREHLGWAWENKVVTQWSMSGVDLRWADLTKADLRGADLREADLREADLSKTDLTETDLTETDLRGANLYGANLYGANLYGADLRGANLVGANLYGADLIGATWSDHTPPAGWRVNTEGRLEKC